VINRFRGDVTLLTPGLTWLERETGIPVLGVLPYLHGLTLEAEDALPRERADEKSNALRVVVPVLPRISNHTDFDPLRAHPDVWFRYVGPGDEMPPADVVILPGSKAVRADLAYLRERGFDSYLARHLRYGGKVIGLCGGLQMLGRVVHDPNGLEGPKGSTPGFGFLDFETTLEHEKQLKRVRGELCLGASRAPVEGYEIHHGISRGAAFDRPLLALDGVPEGAVSEDGQVIGTYVHGLFDTKEALSALLEHAGVHAPASVDYASLVEASLDRLADTIESHLDMRSVLALVGCEP
jgi:adenosylcobyric acid synthase